MSHPTQPPERPSAGFSIVELVIAILILAIGVLGIASATGYMVRQITLAEVTSERAAAVQLVVERLKSTPYASLDIGSDTLTGVIDADYQPPFAFTGKLNRLTLKLDRPQLSPEDIEKLKSAMRNNKVSE